MFTYKTEKNIDRQIRQISFLSQYNIHTLKHVQCKENVVPGALSRFEVSASQVAPDLKQWSVDQAADPELNGQNVHYDFNPRALQ